MFGTSTASLLSAASQSSLKRSSDVRLGIYGPLAKRMQNSVLRLGRVWVQGKQQKLGQRAPRVNVGI